MIKVKQATYVRLLHPECGMRKHNGILGHPIGPGGAVRPSFQLSLVVVLEAKHGDMEHGLEGVLSTHDALDEAKFATTHVRESGTQVPAAGKPLLATAAEQPLLEHLALGLLGRGGAA